MLLDDNDAINDGNTVVVNLKKRNVEGPCLLI